MPLLFARSPVGAGDDGERGWITVEMADQVGHDGEGAGDDVDRPSLPA